MMGFVWPIVRQAALWVSPPYTEVRDFAQAPGVQGRPWEQPHSSLLPLWGSEGAQAQRVSHLSLQTPLHSH